MARPRKVLALGGVVAPAVKTKAPLGDAYAPTGTHAPKPNATGVRARPGTGRRAWAVPLAIVAGAAALRLWGIAHDAQDPFYDAAVRSMGQSWHNFFFGALDPSGRLGIDKPPVDLWLQVASTKLLGFDRTALNLPEALGGIASVALLYAAVARAAGRLAGAIAAAALAVLPVAVLTARSDTMDSVMCALLVGALWTAVEALRGGRARYLLASAALVGVAFNVKLTQALVPLPALAIMWLAAVRGVAPATMPKRDPAAVREREPTRTRRRAMKLAGCAAVLVAVSLAWAAVASLTPLGARPYPIGSHTGSIFKAIFVFNGIERLTGAAHELAPYATTSPAGPVRLLGSAPPDYLKLIGIELLAAAMLLGAAGALWWRGHRPLRAAWSKPAEPQQRAARWTAIALTVWLAISYVVFSFSGHLQPRYLEAAAPAVAATIGIGAAYLLARLLARVSSPAKAGVSLRYVPSNAGVFARASPLLGPATLVLALLALLALQTRDSVEVVQRHSGDANPSGAGDRYGPYLRAHRHGARYEVAATNPLAVVGLIAQDGQPVLILRTIDGEMVTLPQLRRLVSERAVRYVLVQSPCTSGKHCAATTSWSLRNSVPVRPGLYRYLPPGELRQ